MKQLKFFITVLVIITGLQVFADVMPYYKTALPKETIGFLRMPESFAVYKSPDADIADSVKWNKEGVFAGKQELEYSKVFSVFLKRKNAAFCIVTDEQEGWYKILYDKSSNKYGWVKPKAEDDFWGLRDFYSYYGKKYGLYYMKDVDYRNRGIYSAADGKSQKLGGFTLIDNIKLNKISGNWVLVTVVDFDSKPKIGYIQWREPDGTLLMFPKFD